ncbi:MAG: zinc transporter ZntB [Alphaproteobacteria bacterium]|nr:zinc transporter ZntB [Alphaproteobacteria bacterium]
MQRDDSWITAHYLDGTGAAEKMSGALLPKDLAGDRCVWIQLNMLEFAAKIWLREESRFPEVVVEALLADETRPRCMMLGDSLLLNLRGVNMNPGADPADMVSIRIWANDRIIVSTQRRRLRAVNDVEKHLHDGTGPKNGAELLDDLSDSLSERMSHVVSNISDQVDQLEEMILDENEHETRTRLRALRREVIGLRRYIAPQREAMAALAAEDISWIPPRERQHIRSSADRLTLFVEDIDMVRERAAIIQDELSSNLSERMNKNMYVLSIVAGIFLPLTLITGLLGINVAGIPAADWPWAFAAVTGLLVLFGVAELFLLRRLHWL